MTNQLIIKNITISLLPTQPGVYFFKDTSDHILYVGKAKNLQKRISQYFSPGSVWKQDMVNKANKIDFVVVNNESEALYLEDNLIKKNKPYYNNMLKADNSYCYVKITKHDFPQIFLTRDRRNDGATYIGPKHNTQELKKFIQYIRQVFQFRGCKDAQFKQGKLCSDYYFGLCKGRCLYKNGNIEKWKNGKINGINKEEYKKIINLIVSFFKGNTKPVSDELKAEIDVAVVKQNFEWATKLRDIYFHIQDLVERQNVVLSSNTTGYILKIKKIKQRFVYVLLNFFEGKLIDIIENKILESDADFGNITASLEADFGDFVYFQNDPKLSDIDKFIITENHTEKGILGINTKIKKLKKEEKNQISELLEKFIDGYILKNSFQETDLINDMLSGIQTRYKLKNFPYRIECIDISHLSGGWISGGLSCFVGGIPHKNNYRKYKIKNKNIDDYDALKEVIERRFKKNGNMEKLKDGKIMEETLNKDTNIFPSFNVSILQSNELPNLLVIDGGKGQLQVAKKLIESDSTYKEIFSQIDVVSLGKGDARKRAGKSAGEKEKIYYFDSAMNIKSIDMIYDQVDKILIQIRDEAHRFSNYYRKQQMSKEFKV